MYKFILSGTDYLPGNLNTELPKGYTSFYELYISIKKPLQRLDFKNKYITVGISLSLNDERTPVYIYDLEFIKAKALDYLLIKLPIFDIDLLFRIKQVLLTHFSYVRFEDIESLHVFIDNLLQLAKETKFAEVK